MTIGRVAVASGVAFAALQLVRPEFTNPPVTAELQAPPEVKQILERSCYACHSNETRLSWFDRIVPAFWLVASDVKMAREHINFSELGAQPAARQRAVLFEAVNFIQMGAMPLPSYRRVHPEAGVTAAQLAVLRNYAQAAGEFAGGVPAAPNGIAFLPDYKNWKAISMTDRTDTGTLRVILGNDAAIQAIASREINPWPDGTVFAKVAWSKATDEDGVARSGEFLQVAFMIKDRRKYASTVGWGWAAWTGTELKPFGAGSHFAEDCVACHSPLRGNDYVFTAPIGSVK